MLVVDWREEDRIFKDAILQAAVSHGWKRYETGHGLIELFIDPKEDGMGFIERQRVRCHRDFVTKPPYGEVDYTQYTTEDDNVPGSKKKTRNYSTAVQRVADLIIKSKWRNRPKPPKPKTKPKNYRVLELE